MAKLDEDSGGKIKPSGYTHEFTPDEALEIMKCQNDVIYFIKKYCYVVHPTKGRIKFKLYPYQEDLIRTYIENDRVVSLLPRQSGKCCLPTTWIHCKNEKTLPNSKNQAHIYKKQIGDLIKLNIKERVIKWLEEKRVGLALYVKKFSTDYRYKSFAKIGIKIIDGILWSIDKDYRNLETISDDDTKKFTHVQEVDFESDFGKAKKAFRTIPYEVWYLKTENHELLAADKHIVIDEHGDNRWIQDLRIGDKLKTDTGIEEVVEVFSLDTYSHMYDLEIDTEDHLFYTNGILSHNTVTAAAFLLWWAAFKKNQYVLIASNKGDNAKDIMSRLKFMYEELPWFLKPGASTSNVFSVKFDNGSSIQAETTTAGTGRGRSVSLFYLDEFAFVPANITGPFWTSVFPALSCVTGDTLVLTENGFMKIEDFHKDRMIGEYFELDGLKVWGKEGIEDVSHGYVSPESDTLIIRTRHGLKLEVTHNHPLYKASSFGGEMTKAKDLQVGDHLRVDVGMDVFGKDDFISEELAYLLGGYIAEGWTGNGGASGEKSSIWISNTEDDFRRKFLENSIKPFRPVNGEQHKMVVSSRPMIQLFRDCGVDIDAKCYDKTIPTRIFQSPKNVVSKFLQGLFDGDGSATDRAINLTSTSERLIQEVQLLLLNFGIVANVYKNLGENKKPHTNEVGRKPLTNFRDSWSLNVPLSQYAMFGELIGFGITRKQQKLEEIVRIRDQNDFKHYKLPIKEVITTIQNIFDKSGKSTYWFRQNGVRLDKILNHQNDYITVDWLDKFEKLVDKSLLSDDELRFFEEYNRKAFWDEIVSITPSTNKTYDFTVPETHSFLQNGIIGSNTGGRCIITSTPNSDEDKFSQIWFAAKLSPYSDPWMDKLSPNRNAKDSEEEEDYETQFEDEEAEHRYTYQQLNNMPVDDEDDTNGGFTGFFSPWTKVPDVNTKSGYRDESFKRKILASGFSDTDWNREYECSFISAEATLISPTILLSLAQHLRKPKFVDKWGCRWYEEIKPNTVYAVTLDPSEGVDLDDSVIQVWKLPTLHQVAEWNDNKCDQIEQLKMLRRVLRRIEKTQLSMVEQIKEPEIYYSVERTGLGIGILNMINFSNDRMPGWLIDSSQSSINIKGKADFGQDKVNKYRGLLTTTASKKRFCIEFKNLVERSLFIPRSNILLSQMKTFVRHGQSYAAKTGFKDDVVMSCVLMCHLIEELRYHEPDLDNLINPDLEGHFDDDNPYNAPLIPIIG